MKFTQAVLSIVLAAAVAVTAAVAQEKDPEPKGKRQRVRGDVVKVQPDGNQLTIKTSDGKELTLHVTDQSKVFLSDRPLKLEQFKEGTRVRVAYEVRDGKNVIVNMNEAIFGKADVRQEAREGLDAAGKFDPQVIAAGGFTLAQDAQSVLGASSAVWQRLSSPVAQMGCFSQGAIHPRIEDASFVRSLSGGKWGTWRVGVVSSPQNRPASRVADHGARLNAELDGCR